MTAANFPFSAVLSTAITRWLRGVLVRTKESLAVEVDEVRWCIRHPDFGLPRDLAQITNELLTRHEGRYENERRRRVREQPLQLAVAKRAHRPMARNRLYEHEPILL